MKYSNALANIMRLDNVKNLCQYILRYTVGAPTSLVIGSFSCFTLLTKLQFGAKCCAFEV